MKNRKKAFTLSEVVITLVVIGIVAAITVPMLSNSASDKKWNVARQKAQATIGEAFRLMTVNNEITTSKTTAQFVEQVIPKYLKLDKTCGSGAAAAGACGFKTVSNTPKIKRPDGVEVNLPLTWSNSTNLIGNTATNVKNNYNNSYFFRTLDGFSVNFFYNPYCSADDNILFKPVLDFVCFNAVYDMNGKTGPNQFGKDIGVIGSFFNAYTVKTSALLPHKNAITLNTLDNNRYYAITGGNYCKKLGGKDDVWVMADIYDVMLIWLNKSIINLSSQAYFYSRTQDLSYKAEKYNYLIDVMNGGWLGKVYQGNRGLHSSNTTFRCVRANALK